MLPPPYLPHPLKLLNPLSPPINLSSKSTNFLIKIWYFQKNVIHLPLEIRIKQG